MNDKSPRVFRLVLPPHFMVALTAFVMLFLVAVLIFPGPRSRDLPRRTVCASNLKGLGEAQYIYAQDGDVFTMNSGIDVKNSGRMRLFFPSDRGPSQPSSTGTPSPTVDMWMLLRANNSTPKQFNCPQADDTPDPAKDTTAYYDFLTAAHLSYTYQFQHDPNRKALGVNSEPIFPLMADSNPYIKGGVQSAIVADRNSKWRGNSTNHPKREGQNVLFVDSHVQFCKSPDFGLKGQSLGSLTASSGRDNIYTVHAAAAAVDPGEYGPKLNNTTCQLGDKSDAALVP